MKFVIPPILGMVHQTGLRICFEVESTHLMHIYIQGDRVEHHTIEVPSGRPYALSLKSLRPDTPYIITLELDKGEKKILEVKTLGCTFMLITDRTSIVELGESPSPDFDLVEGLDTKGDHSLVGYVVSLGQDPIREDIQKLIRRGEPYTPRLYRNVYRRQWSQGLADMPNYFLGVCSEESPDVWMARQRYETNLLEDLEHPTPTQNLFLRIGNTAFLRPDLRTRSMKFFECKNFIHVDRIIFLLPRSRSLPSTLKPLVSSYKGPYSSPNAQRRSKKASKARGYHEYRLK